MERRLHEGPFNFARKRAFPKNSLAGESYQFYMGYSSSGKAVNERSAMQITAVYACARVPLKAIAGLPLHLYHDLPCDYYKRSV